MASDVEGLGFNEFAIAESLGPGVPIDLEGVRPPFTAVAMMADALFASPPLPTTEHDMLAPIWKDQNINLQAAMASGGSARDFYQPRYGDVGGTRVVSQSETEKETKINQHSSR